MKSSDLTRIYEQAKRAYEEACIAKERIVSILDAIPVTGSSESAYREYLKPIAETAVQSVEATFDVQYDLEKLIEELQAVEENEQ